MPSRSSSPEGSLFQHTNSRHFHFSILTFTLKTAIFSCALILLISACLIQSNLLKLPFTSHYNIAVFSWCQRQSPSMVVQKQGRMEDDDEQPLDFSKKSRNNSSESESHASLPRSDESCSPVNYNLKSPPPSSQQQQRPSVITCAPGLMRAKLTAAAAVQQASLIASASGRTSLHHDGDQHLSHHHHSRHHNHHHRRSLEAPPPPYSAYHENGRLHGAKKPPAYEDESMEIDKEVVGKRNSLSAICDPAIDEHFRRSLGKDYPGFASKTATEPATVSTSGKCCFIDAYFSSPSNSCLIYCVFHSRLT